MEQLHQKGYQVHAWPLRSFEDVQKALELGVDGGTFDDPGAAVQWLAEAGRLKSA